MEAVRLRNFDQYFIGDTTSVRICVRENINALGFRFPSSHPRHRSFHYFLHMEGPTKPTDIALYKWFKTNPSAVVSIGHSVDCQLQLVWDLQAYIAPVQAQIIYQDGIHYLCPVEEGVYDGKGHPLTTGRHYRLYHGRRFVIGRSQL